MFKIEYVIPHINKKMCDHLNNFNLVDRMFFSLCKNFIVPLKKKTNKHASSKICKHYLYEFRHLNYDDGD